MKEWEETVLSIQKLEDLQDEGLEYPGDAIILQQNTAKAQAKPTWEAACQAERERILKWLKSFAKEHPIAVAGNLIDLIEASKPAPE